MRKVESVGSLLERNRRCTDPGVSVEGKVKRAVGHSCGCEVMK